MNIHEYQAKELLKSYGAPVAGGAVVLSADEAEAKAKELPGPLWVVKAQIHAGGRGKGHFKEAAAGEKGGVRLAKSAEEAAEQAKAMFGNTLVTIQTGEAGKQVNRIYFEDGADIESELYLSVLVDRATGKVAFIASTEGGMDIEAVAEETPEKIVTVTVEPSEGVTDEVAQKIVSGLKLEGVGAEDGIALMKTLYKAFVEKDMAMLEINPLIVMPDGHLRVLDAKVGFDPNASFRHPDIMELRDLTEEDPFEIKASEYDLSYVKLDGTIGCMVN
ncbi:MAG: ATP-grasp domain-containing protein, partial [Pseudomonadota bacterium]